MRATALLVLAALLLPHALAQDAPPSRPASFLVYRPWPDPLAQTPEADPEATPLAPPPQGAERLPATLFDGVARAASAPENAPERALAHYREFQRLLQERETRGAPLALTLDGVVSPGALTARVALAPKAVAPSAVDLQLVLFEHGPRPYAARFVAEPVRIDLSRGDASTQQQVRLDPAWNVDRLGVVAIARDGPEVVQSATWMPRFDRPTVQTEKAVLVEHVTASWCDPCAPADEALALLSAQRGLAGALAQEEPPSFLRPADWRLYAGLALGGLAAALVVGRRRA